MKFQQIIKKNKAHFSESEKEICHYIYTHQKAIPTMSITCLAKLTYTSKSSILRFVQKLGFKGYSEFKYLIDWHDLTEQNTENFSIADLTAYLNTVLSTIPKKDLTDFFTQLRHKNNIYILATGTDQHIQSQNFVRSFLKLNVVCTLIPGNTNLELSSIVLENIKKDDLLIVFSGSGSNPQLNELLSIPLMNEIPIVSLTSTIDNWLVKHSLINFSLALEPHNSAINLYSSGLMHMLVDFIANHYYSYIAENLTK